MATFYASAGAGIVGAVITWVFLPDTTGLELAEIDRLHRYMLAGQVRVSAWQAGSMDASAGCPRASGLPWLGSARARQPTFLPCSADSKLPRPRHQPQAPVSVRALARLR